MYSQGAAQTAEPGVILKKTVRVLREMYHRRRHNFIFKPGEICHRVGCNPVVLEDKLMRLVELGIIQIKRKDKDMTMYRTAFNYKKTRKKYY